jgi:hypothetical protein
LSPPSSLLLFHFSTFSSPPLLPSPLLLFHFSSFSPKMSTASGDHLLSGDSDFLFSNDGGHL